MLHITVVLMVAVCQSWGGDGKGGLLLEELGEEATLFFILAKST
jgi:hypothetical protein